MMNGFAIIFGTCLWTPPSGKAAVLAILWFFGQGDVDAARAGIVQQYVASGKTVEVATSKAEDLWQCFGTWEKPALQREADNDK